MAKRYSARVQTLFTEEEYALLKHYAEADGKSVSGFVRETMVSECLARRERERRRAAVARIAKGNLPVCDWPEMERQIEEARFAD